MSSLSKTQVINGTKNRPILIRDLQISGQCLYLHLPRRQFYCAFCQQYFTERLSFIDWERRYTQRYEKAICQRLQTTSIEQVSREEELSWDQVQGIFNHRFNQKKADWGAVTRLSIDEISQRKGHQAFATVVCDIDRGKLLEVIDRHVQEDIIRILKQQPIELRERV